MNRSYHNHDLYRKNARNHFIRRCRERLKIHISNADYQKILLAIKYNQRIGKISALFIQDLGENRKLYEVNYYGTRMYIIYNVELQELLTSLPSIPHSLKEKNYVAGTSIF